MAPPRPTSPRASAQGVELKFLGLNNQNLHNMLFRGFLKPWEDYTGATINWIDLAQADYNGRLQQAIATGTVDWDIMEMGAPFEGDTAGRGLLDPMPDWVATQIDMDDYVDYLKAPIGTWGGKTYRISIDGDTHTLAYRTDYYDNEEFAAAWAEEGHEGEWAPPTTWEQVNEQSKFLAGKTDPLTGLDAYGIVDPLKYVWGGFGFYFLADRAAAYAKHPDGPAWLFDPDTMKPLVNNPAWVQAIQDVIDLMGTAGAYPPDQLNADPEHHRLPAVPGRHRRAGHVVGRHRLERPHVRHLRRGRCRRLRHQPGLGARLQLADRRVGGHPEPVAHERLHRLGRLRDQQRLRRRAEAQVRLVGRGPPGRQGHLALDGGLSVRLPALPQLALQLRRVGGRRLRPGLHQGLPLVER